MTPGRALAAFDAAVEQMLNASYMTPSPPILQGLRALFIAELASQPQSESTLTAPENADPPEHKPIQPDGDATP